MPRAARLLAIALASLLFASGCASQGTTAPSEDRRALPASGSPTSSGSSVVALEPAAPDPTTKPAPEAPPPLTVAEAEAVLFADAELAAERAGCAGGHERLACLFGLRYRKDPEALRLAMTLHAEGGHVAGVERERILEGGFRGKLRLVPEPPVGAHRRHLGWIVEASRDFDAFFRELAERGGALARYRSRALAYRFFRSVGRTTPSAYAQGWTLGYNVAGSLHRSAEAVRDTLFHEIFHLNDADHRGWSRRMLGETYDDIVRRCGTRAACLAPYAPHTTRVRGGTYYAFQPDNGDGVAEYAAELAVRYFLEQRAVLRGERPTQPAFKCTPSPGRALEGEAVPSVNYVAWTLLAEEFFGGVDLVPPC